VLLHPGDDLRRVTAEAGLVAPDEIVDLVLGDVFSNWARVGAGSVPLKPPIAMIGSSLASGNGAALGADVYIPLARAQALASMPSEVNTIYV
jgi:hypothetical protein